MPGAPTELYSFDHDLGQFVSIGTGTVTADGTTIASDPGVGVVKAGWHCGGDPQESGVCEAVSVSVDPSQVFVSVGATAPVSASGAPAPAGSPAFAWSSQDEATATVSFTSAGSASTGTITGVALGTAQVSVIYTAQSGQSSLPATAQVTVVSVVVDEVISDMLPGRTCNTLPPQPGVSANPNNPMLVGAQGGSDVHLRVKASITPPTATSLADPFIGIRSVGGSTVIASAQVVSSGAETPINFGAQNGLTQFEVVAGFDTNSDGSLSNDEVTETFGDNIKTITASDYAGAVLGVETLRTAAPGVGGDFFNRFLSSSFAVPDATKSGATLQHTELDHPTGAEWSASSCSADTDLYTFNDGTVVSNDVETSCTVVDFINDELSSRSSIVLTPIIHDGYRI